MKKDKFTLGIDFGTQSARCVLVRVKDGEEVASSVYSYPQGVIDDSLPGTRIKLPPEWALQNPQDWLEAVKRTVREVLKNSGVKPEWVIGVGIDFTSCTMLPTTREGVPLCRIEKFKNRPHAWAKLWKHHASQPQADRINELAKEREERFLERYGGKISSEWFFPKALQILEEDPEIYQASERLIEGADWIVWMLTGEEKRNWCTAGYKAIWDPEEGFPSPDFFHALDPRFEKVVEEKLSKKIYPLGEKAGGLTPFMAEETGLKEGTPVAVGNVDAHVSVPAVGVVEPGKLVMVMGTSICHMVLGESFRPIPGLCGIVRDGIIPGWWGYEAGQSAVGDIFEWFIKNLVPLSLWAEAKKRGLDLHSLLEEKAFHYRVGETGLLALDWWNGNRSILVDANLSGLLLGCTLGTKAEEIYRALIEATAFGTYRIINSLEEGGIRIKEIYVCGGLCKNKLLMQIYADVTGRTLKVARSPYASAFGSSIFATLAAGKKRGGYDSIEEAVEKITGLPKKVFYPDPENHTLYQKLYREYERLHDYFGRGENEIMKRLKVLKKDAGRT